MALQFVSNQIKDLAISQAKIAANAVNAAKMDLTDTFNFASGTITVATPSADAQAATKGYVDSVAAGLDLKESCKAATTANISLSGTQTIDGISITANDRVLVKDQSTGTENGIYVCSAGSWSRASDFAAGDDEAGAFTFIEQGTANGDNGFVCTNNKGAGVVGTNALVFTQFSGAGQITAGNGLAKSGNTLSVNVDNSSIEINSDSLRVKASGITDAMLAGSISAGKLAGSIGNDKLSNSSVSFGGVSLALGASDATPAFNLSDATSYPTSSLVGTITNAQLAGSIANSKLANSSVSFGGVSLALGASDATPAFDLSDATSYPTSSLVGTITNAQLAGGIADSKLSTISTANKVSGSAVQLQSNKGIADSTGLGLVLDGSSLTVGASGLKVNASGVTNAMLAGSIDNGKLSNSSVTVTAGNALTGGGSVSLGASVSLDVAVDDSSIEVFSDAIRVKASGISNAMLAGSIADSKLSTITTANKVSGSAVQLQSNKGISNSSGLGLVLDGSSLGVGASGLKVSDLGIGTAQIANSAVTLAKVGFSAEVDTLSPDGSTSGFNLTQQITIAAFHKMAIVMRNGQVCKAVASSPSGASEYTIANSGANTVVTFGDNPASDDVLQVHYLY